jgi:ACS family hexuronate transporter-like MFS transporter
MVDPNLIVADEPSGPGHASASSPPESRGGGVFAGNFRWVICGLLFFGVTKNYMDRQVLGVLKGPLQHEFGWNEIDYGNLVFAFQAAYALGMIFVGRLIDRVGTRIGYAVAMVFWSLASMGHAIAFSLPSFIAARAALGFGEAGVFPASIKCVAEWFPKKERALATGIFNAGTNIGAIVTPLIVPWIAVDLGWRWAFLLTGALGFVWLILWLWLYRNPEQHPYCTSAERAYIQSDPVAPAGKITWSQLLPHRQTWAFAAGKFMIDPIWWFYLFWIPDYLQRNHGLHLTQIGLPILLIYVISDLGSIGGGWFSSSLIRRGVSVNAARKWAMFLCALGVLPIAIVYRLSGLWSSRFFCKFVHALVRPFSIPRSGICCRNWRHGRGDWWNADRRNRRPCAAVDGKLHGSFFHSGISLFDRVVVHTSSESPARTRADRRELNR